MIFICYTCFVIKIITKKFMEVFHMKIAVAASNGKASRAVISELIARGHEVTAFARSENKSAAKNFVQKDIMNLT